MFEEPQAKRVRRTEVFHEDFIVSEHEKENGTNETKNDPDDSDDDDLSNLPVYHFDYELIENPTGKPTEFAHLRIDDVEQPKENQPQADESFEFRLFSSKSSISKTKEEEKEPHSRITIRSPTPPTPSDGRFINPHRPQSYYFISPHPSQDNLNTFATTAISGSTVLSLSHTPWPGTNLPSRVIHLPASKHNRPTRKSKLGSNDHRSTITTTSKSKGGKRKPSKARRILLRTLAKATEAKAREKEEHLREKKTRLNRQKQIRKRAKEKAAKMASAEVKS